MLQTTKLGLPWPCTSSGVSHALALSYPSTPSFPLLVQYHLSLWMVHLTAGGTMRLNDDTEFRRMQYLSAASARPNIPDQHPP